MVEVHAADMACPAELSPRNEVVDGRDVQLSAKLLSGDVAIPGMLMCDARHDPKVLSLHDTQPTVDPPDPT